MPSQIDQERIRRILDARRNMQIDRIQATFANACEGEDLQAFINQRKGRTLSSIEEELLCRLPAFDEDDAKRISEKASSILGGSTTITEPAQFAKVRQTDPVFGKELQAFGLCNFATFIQAQFYEQAIPLLQRHGYGFDARYEKQSQMKFGNTNALCLETYNYTPAQGYRSVFFHLLRHLDDVTDDMFPGEVEFHARNSLQGKRILEVGCGPGFFLHALKDLGATVIGVEADPKYRKQAQDAGLEIKYGNAKYLANLVTNDGPFDIVYSRDFLSIAVTKDEAEPIVQAIHSIMRPGGLMLHQIDYSKMAEEKYIQSVRDICTKNGSDPTPMIDNFRCMDEQHKDMLLRRNIFNIHPGHVVELGFTPLAPLRYDAEQTLTMTFQKK